MPESRFYAKFAVFHNKDFLFLSCGCHIYAYYIIGLPCKNLHTANLPRTFTICKQSAAHIKMHGTKETLIKSFLPFFKMSSKEKARTFFKKAKRLLRINQRILIIQILAELKLKSRGINVRIMWKIKIFVFSALIQLGDIV